MDSGCTLVSVVLLLKNTCIEGQTRYTIIAKYFNVPIGWRDPAGAIAGCSLPPSSRALKPHVTEAVLWQTVPSDSCPTV